MFKEELELKGAAYLAEYAKDNRTLYDAYFNDFKNYADYIYNKCVENNIDLENNEHYRNIVCEVYRKAMEHYLSSLIEEAEYGVQQEITVQGLIDQELSSIFGISTPEKK